MKSFSNTYIFTFSAIMVTIVAALLAFIAMQLKPIQTSNMEAEKMQNILASVGIESKGSDVETVYNKYITESYVIKPSGEIVESVSAFTVDLKKELAKIEKINSLKGMLEEKTHQPF
jgi:Na+-transporting NADH:ubiquinone oxidoreductase subunit C